MGVGISGWVLARAVSMQGQMGVVSGTALDCLLVRRLQDGDPGGHLREAMSRFPRPSVTGEALRRFFKPDGRDEGEPYLPLPLYGHVVDRFREQLVVLANFVEVNLAKAGHDGLVGLNLLTKIQLPNLPSLYGAMLAGVDCVLMGAGIPREIPGVLDRLAQHEPVSMNLEVVGPRSDEPVRLSFDPRESLGEDSGPPLKRPSFLPIVASHSLAAMMARKANGRVDGFVVEGPTAGGHNAPPRGPKQLTSRGEPQYGERDVVDLDKVVELGLPFWLAGGAGHPGRLAEACAAGGAGIQVGTLFAFCEESALAESYKSRVLEMCRKGDVDVFTDDRASPTGFPFKIVQLKGSLSCPEVFLSRERSCDLGYLRTAYRRPDGRIGYRCPGEPVATFIKKGGRPEETQGRRCLCNALVANVGLGQIREGGVQEAPLLTSGDDLKALGGFLGDRSSYSATDVIDYLLA